MGVAEGDPRPIRVFLADDHPVVRDGVKAVIAATGRGIEVLGEASSGLEVIEFARNNAADVYVLDIAMPGLDGLQTTEKLLRLDPGTRVIILSVYTDRSVVQNALRAGARAYVVKDTAAADITRAIRLVHGGSYYVSPAVSEYLTEQITDPGSPVVDALSPLQREILSLLCDGLPEKEIAYRLQLSLNTVHTHKHALMRRLDAHSTAELVRNAIKAGLVPMDPPGRPEGP